MLEYTEKTVRTVRSGHLEEFIEKVYGEPYSFEVAQECGNDTVHSFKVTGELSKRDADRMDRWLVGGGVAPWPQTVLNDLANRRMIPLGQYLVEVSH